MRFADGVRALAEAGSTVFLEIGPAPTLLGMAARCLSGGSAAWLPSLRPGRGDWETMLESLAALWTRGVPVDWDGFERGYRRRRVALPTSPFRRERHWVDAAPVSRARSSTAGRPVHPLLGERLRSALDTVQFESVIGPRQLAYLGEHRVHGVALAPASAFVEMALAAVEPPGRVASSAVEDLRILSPLQFPDDGQRVVQVLATPEDRSGASVVIASLASEDTEASTWRRHATARVLARTAEAPPLAAEPVDTIRARCSEDWMGERLYARLAGQGIELGPSFRGISRLWRRDGEALAEIALPPSAGDGAPYHVHPALLDAALQAVGAAWPEGRQGSYVLAGSAVSICGRRLLPRRSCTRCSIRPRRHRRRWPPATSRSSTGRVTCWRARGASSCGALLRDGLTALTETGADWCYEVVWEPTPLRPARRPLPRWRAPPTSRPASRPRSPRWRRRTRSSAHDAPLRALDAVATGHVLEALRALGWDPRPGDGVATETLAAELGVVPAHRRLFGRMLAMLAEDDVLVAAEGRPGERWIVHRRPEISQAREAHAALAGSSVSAELALLDRCGARLADVLRGGTDPLQLLFPQGELESVERIYESGPVARVFNTLVRRAVEVAVAALPPGRRLRVLEIGAGTGATTAAVLPALSSSRTEYVFTDLSPLFLARGRRKIPRRAVPHVPESRHRARSGSTGIRDGRLRSRHRCQRAACHAGPSAHARPRARAARGGRFAGAARGDGAVPMGRPHLRPHRGVVAVRRRRAAPVLSAPVARTLGGAAGRGGLRRRSGGARRGGRGARAVQPVGDPRAPSATDGARRLAGARRPGRRRSALGRTRARARRALCGRHGGRDRRPARGGRVGPSARASRGLPCAGAGPRRARGRSVVSSASPLDARRRRRLARLVAGGAGARRGKPAASRAGARRLARGGTHAPVGRDQRRPAGDEARRRARRGGGTGVGIGRVLALEHPELWGGLVDLDPDDPDPAAALVGELASTDGEDQVALRADGRRVARLRRRAPLAGAVPALRADATYLVTGGLGGLGLKVAEWLARHGVRHLVLLGRQGIEGGTAAETGRRQAGLRALEALGATVRVVAGDVADARAVAALLAEVRASMPPLRGVVHAAAALDATPIRELDLERLRAILAPKVLGTWLLDQATRGMDLDFFALFSSTTALLGATRVRALRGGQPVPRRRRPRPPRAGRRRRERQLGHLGRDAGGV